MKKEVKFKKLYRAIQEANYFHLPATLRRQVTLNSWLFCMVFLFQGGGISG